MSNYRQEAHVAQQSRRDKLRVHQSSFIPSLQLENFPHNSQQLPVNQVVTPDIIHFRNAKNGSTLLYDSSILPPDQSCEWIVNSNPMFLGYQDIQSSLTNPCSEISSQDSQKHYVGTHYNSATEIYQPTNPHDIISSSTIATHRVEMDSQLIIPSYGNDTINEWSNEMGLFASNKNFTSDCHTKGLSLSLSSNPPPTQLSSIYLCPNSKASLSSKGCGNSLQDIVGTSTYRNAGPLGPFTGYATILKSSKFLKPAQYLLEEFCSVTGPKFGKTSENYDKNSEEGSISVDGVDAEEDIGIKGRSSGTSTFYNSNEFISEGRNRGSPYESYRPEYRQKKAKLIYMQEEVSRRYRQYHQQMQMVVSSFETVAGLSSATPYVSVALKTVLRHFRCLRNAIADQLRNVRVALGEDSSSPTTGASSSKGGDATTPRFKLVEQSFQKNKPCGSNLGYLEPRQHVWRPQRGLPERSVAILRAWLFEHFLHPYPTDSDKHMLAAQTGLSRNQVSNWFINARVRVWKPMVEEIHMLETKGSAEPDPNSSKNDKQSQNGGGGMRSNGNQRLDGMTGLACNDNDELNEKRSRLDCQIPSSIDASLMGFMPYHRTGFEPGGVGAVSLTLGLRNSSEIGQKQQFQQKEQQLGQHFGGHSIHDFGG